MSPREAATHLARRLRSAGHEALFAGGCVRDKLLGHEPKDFDIATSATPKDVVALFPGSNEVGAHFGVVIAKHHGHHVEIATFRTDGSYKDGRRPETVTFSTPEEDAKRHEAQWPSADTRDSARAMTTEVALQPAQTRSAAGTFQHVRPGATV